MSLMLLERDGEKPAEFELRFAIEPELRAADDAARKLSGYAARFGTPAKIRSYFGEFEEVIERGAFADTLASKADVRLLVQHIRFQLLARTSAGNLTLAEDDIGLRFEATLPDTQLGRDTYEQIRVGNYKAMSFGFRPTKTREEYDDKGRLKRITLQTVNLREVSIVDEPAYPKTSVAIRSLSTRPDAPAPDNRAMRLRLLKLRG